MIESRASSLQPEVFWTNHKHTFKDTMKKVTLTSTLLLITICSVFLNQNLVRGDLETQDSETTKHYFLQKACLDVLNAQINWELYASIVYMNMYGYFNKPGIGRPGFAKFFKEQSSEEYGHALKIIDYMNKRNGTVNRISVNESPKSEWDSPREALEDAIKLEHYVYAKLQHIHSVADQKCQDPHLMDFLETEYFDEQVKSIEELTLMLTKLGSQNAQEGPMLEYWEDGRLRGRTEL